MCLIFANKFVNVQCHGNQLQTRVVLCAQTYSNLVFVSVYLEKTAAQRCVVSKGSKRNVAFELIIERSSPNRTQNSKIDLILNDA